MEFRVGQGIDIHPFERGKKLMLGGVEIPHEFGLQGHSDGDALLHALCDALLGAAGLPDIGAHFPDSDAQWRNRESIYFLREVARKLRERDWRVVNIDCTVLTEAPKIGPHVDRMKGAISGALGIDREACGIKATTAERLGFVGRREGLVATAVVLIER